MKKSVSIGIIFLIMLGAIILVIVTMFSLNLFYKSKTSVKNLEDTVYEQMENPCFRAKTFLNINPDKACSILRNAKKCSGIICDCGTFCIKCDYYGEYLGPC